MFLRSLSDCLPLNQRGGSGGDASPPNQKQTLLEVGANHKKTSPLPAEGVNYWQIKYKWSMGSYPEVYHNLRKLSLCRRYKLDLACTECGKDLKQIHLTCNSPLCSVCSREKWKLRTQKAFEALEPFLGIYGVWSMWTFTIPDTLREEAWKWEVLRDLRREAIQIVKEIVGGKAGIGVIQTFSSGDHSKKNPHIHLLVGGRKAEVEYIDVLEAWAKVLEKLFGYKCERKESEKYPNGIPIVIVQEGKKTKFSKGGPFLSGFESLEERKGVLYRKVQYEMRFPGQHYDAGKPEFTDIDLHDGGVFKHYELMFRHQVYCYWGEVINYFRGMALESTSGIRKGVLLGSLNLSRQQKRRLVRELRKKGELTHDLGLRVVGELEYEILKGLPLVLKKSPKKQYDLCRNCGNHLVVLGIWDLLDLEKSWVKNDLLEYLTLYFGDFWAEYARKFERVKGWKTYGQAA